MKSPEDTAAEIFAAGSMIRPMRVIEHGIYRGPHLYSARPMIRIQIDLGSLENWPTSRLDGFAGALVQFLPGLARHGCSYSKPGGFLRRMEEGTWLGHVIEHVALELQTLAGTPVSRGKTRSVRGHPGTYNILYCYKDEKVGLAAGAAAIRLIAALVPAEFSQVEGLDTLGVDVGWAATDVASILQSLRRLREEGSLGPTTRALAEEAERRGIPVMRLDRQSLIQLGYGKRQHRLRASITGQTSQIAVDLAANKDLTKALLAEAGLPVPRGIVVRSADEAAAFAERVGFPLVTKPLDGNHGRGVSTALLSEAQVREGFEIAIKHSRRVVVERHLSGHDHRILVVDGKVVAVAQRVPAQVIGDGYHNVADLIDIVNQDERRGERHEKVLTRIRIDEPLLEMLRRQGKSLESVPLLGEIVGLRGTANLSSGGTAIDRTDEIHPENALVAEQAAMTIGLDVAGIDFLSPDISRSVRETGGGIIEVNAAPGFRMHLEPAEGQARNVAKPVIDMLFPPGRASRIPILAITGTNGKSTTVRMVATILRQAGRNVGLTTTSGIYFNEHLLKAADASGPRSAVMVLRNPAVDVAVLETARGGILREGLAFRHCQIGAVLNVAPDHLGTKGIETLADLAKVKSVVVESVARQGHSILNFDDPITRGMVRHARGRIVWFSLEGGANNGEGLSEHIGAGGMAVLREHGPAGGHIVLYKDRDRISVMAARDIPATLNGRAEFNIANVLAAIAICAAHGVSLDAIRSALKGFASTFEDNPGRLNIIDDHPFRVLIDYAHNPASLEALGFLISQMRVDHGRVIGMVSIPGDRRDEDIVEMGRLSAGIFDFIVFREGPDGRGRPTGEVNALMYKGALEAGALPDCMRQVIIEKEAVNTCLEAGRPGDLVVILPTLVEAVWRQVKAFSPQQVVRESESQSTAPSALVHAHV